MKVGLVTLIGKPNVGKSTLLNKLVGHKVSIVSNKPQTTRKRVLGIAQTEDYQVAFIDTPGIHEPHTKLGRAMVESARESLADIDLIVYVVDASKKPDEHDQRIGKLIADAKAPILLCLNKMDLLDAEFVVERVADFCKLVNLDPESVDNYIFTTATREHNLDILKDRILAHLSEGEELYPDDEYTNQSLRFMVGELIREKVLPKTKQEVPHATAVHVEEWTDEPKVTRISAIIVVEKQGQKAILIGKKGQFIKDIGTLARLEVEEVIGRPVYLELQVKVREDWRMNTSILRELEYID